MGGRDLFDLRELHLAENRVGVARRLPGAAERGELHLEYQPIVDAAVSQLTGVEALLRWTHPNRGPVSPAMFVPFAEQSGQIIELGRWVLEQACSDRERWHRQQAAKIAKSVNVSTYQLMSAGFAKTVAAVLDSTSTNPGLLTLEVTESVFVRDEQRALVVLGELKKIGVNLALDDFGTGYSSLGYLNTLPVDTIKVDQTFVSKVDHEPGSQIIVAAIIQLAHSLGMTVVSEGVETAEQHHELTKLGSDSFQGFYFAKPMRASKLDAVFQQRAEGDRPANPSTDRRLTRAQLASAQLATDRARAVRP